jgi:hypothetical protein
MKNPITIRPGKSLYKWLPLLLIPLLAYGGIRLFKAPEIPPPLVFLLAENDIGPVFFFFGQPDGVDLQADPLGRAVRVPPNGVVKIKAPVDDVMGSSSEKHRATYMVSVGRDGRRKILKMFIGAHKKEDGAWWWGYFDEKNRLHEFKAAGEWTGFSFIPAGLRQERMVFGNEGCRNQGFSPHFAEFAAGAMTAEQAGIPICGKFLVASPDEYATLPDWMWKDLQHPYPSVQAFVDEANERLKRKKSVAQK